MESTVEIVFLISTLILVVVIKLAIYIEKHKLPQENDMRYDEHIDRIVTLIMIMLWITTFFLLMLMLIFFPEDVAGWFNKLVEMFTSK